MNVKFLAYNIYGIGGTVRSVINTANSLAEHGHRVEIISVRRTSEKPTLGLSRSVALRPILDVRGGRNFAGLGPYRTKGKRFLLGRSSRLIHGDEDLYAGFSLYTDFQLAKALRELRDCVLITTIPSFNVLASRRAHKSVTTVGQEHKEFGAHSESIRRAILSSYGKLDAITCVTKESADTYREALAGATRVEHIPNGTPFPSITPHYPSKVVVAAGRLSHEKGFDQLVRAFALVVAQDPTWTLRIFGSGDTTELHRLIFEHQLHNHVFLMGETTQLSRELASAEIFALSSRHESFGMVLVEAMAHELPCVAFACEGPRELLAGNESGCLVPLGDIETFAQRLLELIRDSKRRRELGIAARKAAAPYSTRVVGERWADFLSSLPGKSVPAFTKGAVGAAVNYARSEDHGPLGETTE